MKRHIKHCTLTEASHEHLWYMNVPAAHKPAAVTIVERGLSMELIEPWETPTLDSVWRTAKNVLWQPRLEDRPKLCPGMYAAHVKEVLHKTSLSEYAQALCANMMNQLALLDKISFTPVRHAHGDLTLENVFQRRDSLIVGFIDPGHTRGLPCQELDEAKLLQSADGWKIGYGAALPFTPRRVHHLLLLSHYIRLLAHPEKHQGYWLHWTHERILHMLYSPLGVLYEEARNYYH